MITLKGADVSARIREEVQAALKKLDGVVPRLAIVRVGENPDDISYEKGATKRMDKFGLDVRSYVFPGDIRHEDFAAEFAKINQDPENTGILLLRPLPKQIREKDIEKLMDPDKDSLPGMKAALLPARRRPWWRCCGQTGFPSAESGLPLWAAVWWWASPWPC